MSFKEPFVAYNAGSNIEAHLVCGQLLDAGIDALVIEDVSEAAVGMWGILPVIRKPQVWIERTDTERARVVLTDYDERAAKRLAAEQTECGVTGASISVYCEECGRISEFPSTQKGLVETCPHCGEFVDVGDEIGFEGWNEFPAAGDEKD
jgi:hypothetical protein